MTGKSLTLKELLDGIKSIEHQLEYLAEELLLHDDSLYEFAESALQEARRISSVKCISVE